MKPILCFLFLLITGGALAPTGYSFFEQPHNETHRLEWAGKILTVDTSPEPAVKLFTRSGSAMKWVASLSGEALIGVKAFSPEQALPTRSTDWIVERSTPDHIMMYTDLNGRRLERHFKVDRKREVLQVNTRITWLGNEVVASVFDAWTFEPGAPDFSWVPNLRPEPNLVIGEHSFRSPAVILEKQSAWIAIIPDLDSLPNLPRQRFAALDLNRLDHEKPMFGFGLKAHDPTFHVYYRHDPARVFTYAPGVMSYSYDMLIGTDETRHKMLARVNDQLWNRYAEPLRPDVRPQTLPFEEYARRSYATLDSIRQFETFQLGRYPAGAYRAENHGTYFILPRNIVWNQAWFNAQRTAYGLAYFGSIEQNDAQREKASLITNFSNYAPSWQGLFPAVYHYDQDTWIGSPLRLNGGLHRVHTSSAAWTALWMWRMQRELNPGKEVKARVFDLADFLVQHQADDGSIPAWFDRDPETGEMSAHPTLEASAETGGSSLLLGELALSMGDSSYRAATLQAADFLIAEVLPRMKYFDFETFWSCSWKSPDMEDPYTGVLPQNSYSIYWAAETFRYAWLLSREQKYMDALLESMHTLNLYQQIWNPHFLQLYAFGGFGVMNTDGEWNDSRQAVFAPLYMRVYQATGNPIWMHRGIAALRASFTLFAIPENCELSPHTCKAYAPGLSPESLAHGGLDGASGRSDTGWGEAGALSSAAYVMQHFGQIYVDVQHGHAFGIDGVISSDAKIVRKRIEFEIEESLGHSRTLQLHVSDGRKMEIELKPYEKRMMQIPISP